MTPQEFVECIRREVLEQNLTLYQRDLENSASAGSGKGSSWPQIAKIYQSLDKNEKKELMNGIRQVMIDTLSNVLGIIDGSSLLEKHRDFFHLTYGEDSQELGGELQDLFLSDESQ